jgi:chromosome segregation ATPase
MTLEEQLTATEARLTELTQLLDAERTSTKDLQQRLQDADTARDDEALINGQLQDELKQVRQQKQDLTTRLTKLEAESKIAEAKAAEICASVGVTPLPITANGQRNNDDLLEQLKAQKSPAEQTTFWRKNKDKILKRK